MSSNIVADLRDRYDPDDRRAPHRQPAVLRCALHGHVCSLREAADAISEAFDDDVSKTTVYRAKDHHGIRDAVTDGAFADVLEGNDGSEPAQPPSFILSRSEDTPIHPFDTDCFEKAEVRVGNTERNGKTLPTPRFTSPSDSDSLRTTPDSTVSDLNRGTPLYKGRDSTVPSVYRVTKQYRDESLVAPPHVAKSDDFPDRYCACGCGDCEKRHFLDGDGGSIDCPNPLPVTVGGARRIYRKTAGTNHADEKTGRDTQRGRQQYARLMKADSAVFRTDGPDPFGDNGAFTANGPVRTDHITTVLVSLRVSPTVQLSDGPERLVTPFRLLQDAKDGWAEARDEIPRDCGDGLLSYFWTVAGTDKWATPHIHCYLYYHDPDDAVTREDFKPLVTRFVTSSAFAATDAHITVAWSDDEGGDRDEHDSVNQQPSDDYLPDEYDAENVDLVDGTARIEPDPLLADPRRLSAQTDTTGAFDDVLRDENGADRLIDGDVQSRGAIYVGSQLPTLALLGAEYDAAVEFASFCDLTADGRHLSHGSGAFYSLADTLDTLIEHSTEQSNPTETA